MLSLGGQPDSVWIVFPNNKGLNIFVLKIVKYSVLAERFFYTEYMCVIVNPALPFDTVGNRASSKLVETTTVFSDKNKRFVKDKIINISLQSICPIVWNFTNTLISVFSIYWYPHAVEDITTLFNGE